MRPLAGREQRAISLVEALVVVAMLGILLAVAIPSMSEFVRKKRIEALAEEIRADFSLAKSTSATVDALGRVVWHQVDASNACYTMYVGTNTSMTCDCTKPMGQACGANASQELKVLRVPPGSGIRLAASHKGAFFHEGFKVSPDIFVPGIVIRDIPSYSVTVSDPSGLAMQVRVSPAGQMKVCASGGSFSGYPACE